MIDGRPRRRDRGLYYGEQAERDDLHRQTSQLEQRVASHRHSLIEGFTKRYGCKRLVWFEMHDDMGEAIRREKQLKKWLRKWKLDLIEADNPQWLDLAADWWSDDWASTDLLDS